MKSKKFSLIISSIVFSTIIFSGCGNVNEEQESSLSIAAIVYHTLSDGEKEELANSKPDGDGKVERKVVTKAIVQLTDKSYDGKEVYAVTFKVKENNLLGDITVYFDGEARKVIGRGIRE